ncbi:MAG: flagellar hook basal-body protein [Angelakisella sp.]
MFTGFYTAASGMLTQQRILNVQANNIANIGTPGFKSEQVVSTTFEQTLLSRLEGANSGKIGKGTPIRLVQDVASNFDANMVEQTNRPYDLAIGGEGYFTVEVGEREMLTRNGNFDIDPDGYLVLRGAGRVLGEKGPIQIGGAEFTVTADGTVYDAKEKMLDRLLIQQTTQGAQLEKFANGLYTIPQGQEETALQQNPDVMVYQGFTERSNVDINREMTMVIETQRNFQTCNNALKMIDQMNQKTASQIASL